MVSLGQKLKMPKTCEKRFYKNIRVVLCKKPLQKTPNIRKTILRRIYAIFFVYLLKQASAALMADVGPVTEKTQLVNAENTAWMKPLGNDVMWRKGLLLGK